MFTLFAGVLIYLAHEYIALLRGIDYGPSRSVVFRDIKYMTCITESL